MLLRAFRKVQKKAYEYIVSLLQSWSERQDSNLRPSGPKPDALPTCATLRREKISKEFFSALQGKSADSIKKIQKKANFN